MEKLEKLAVIPNSDYSHSTSYFNKLMKLVSERRTALERLLSSSEYHFRVLRLAGKRAGMRPSWHLEKGLLQRVKQANLAGAIVDFGKLESSDFETQLRKGERLMTTPPVVDINNKKLIHAMLSVEKKCKFPNKKFRPTTFEYAAENQVNHRSSSGFPRFVKKGTILQELVNQAKYAVTHPFHGIWNWPSTRGFRLQIRESLGQLSRKIRLMYPVPGWLIVLEDTFIIPLVSHFISTDTFYVIGRNSEQVGKLLKNCLSNSKHITSLDVNSFDQTLCNEAIVAAFTLIRRQFILTKEEALAFEQMVGYFCTSIMVSRSQNEPYYAFVKDHGVPSGSGFTNMIDTLAHAIIVEYLEPNLLDKALICGDDNIFDSSKVNVPKFIAGYSKFNLTVDLKKTDIYKDSNKIKFLGFNWVNFIKMVSYKLVINQALWHQEFTTDLEPYDRELSRCASIFLNGKNGKDLFFRIFPDIKVKLDMGIDIRFTYMLGYSIPIEKVGVGKQPGPYPNQSLIEQLEKGYLMR